MKEARNEKPVYRFILLLSLGFLGLCLPNLVRLSVGNGVFTAIWILSFLYLTCRFPSGRDMRITCAVFLAGYFLKYIGQIEFEWTYAALFLLMGLVQFSIFFVYSRLIRRWNRFPVTLAFPLLWMAVYLLAMLVRFPSMIRVDMMFADTNVLLQAESLLGSSGLSFVLLWIFSLTSFAVYNRKPGPALLGAGLYLAALAVGLVYLYPNVTENETVRVALSTGPYVGSYTDYSTLPVERHLESMRFCVAEAAEQGAEIIVFNEETYEIPDTEEESFLAECCRAAQENSIHVLLGLDLPDTDGSEGGKSQNKVVWISDTGEILGSYLKTMTIPMLESDYVKGDGVIPSHVISVGGKEIKVSYLICYDSNFPLYVDRMADDTDILFLPSWDWAAVTSLHSVLCRTIAVENRVSVVKPTYDGISIAVRPDGTVIGSFVTGEVGYEQVRVMDIPVGGSGGLTPEIAEKGHYIYSIIGVEILSFLIGLVLLYGSLCENHEKTPRNNLYSCSVIACMLALPADAVSWIFDGCTRMNPVLYVSTVISLIMTFVLDGIFVFYITEYIREKKPVSSRTAKIYMVFVFIAVILIAASTGTGALFIYENGVYREGPWYGVYLIANLICSAVCLSINLIQMRSMPRHDRVATLSFIAIPWTAAVINLFDENFSYAYPAIVLSLAVLYIMIQAERQDRLEKEGVISYYHAHHDALTGLLNRLAYEEKLRKISGSDGRTGAVFTDVNGLKYTNDNYGHEAGDQLLTRYAQLLCQYFRKEEIFRISGDEFAVLPDGISENALRNRTEEFRRALNKEAVPMASVGTAFGNSRDINELLREAEAGMYVEKEMFHRNHPEMERR